MWMWEGATRGKQTWWLGMFSEPFAYKDFRLFWLLLSLSSLNSLAQPSRADRPLSAVLYQPPHASSRERSTNREEPSRVWLKWSGDCSTGCTGRGWGKGVQPEEERSRKGPNSHLPLPDGVLQRRCSQALLKGAEQKDKIGGNRFCGDELRKHWNKCSEGSQSWELSKLNWTKPCTTWSNFEAILALNRRLNYKISKGPAFIFLWNEARNKEVASGHTRNLCPSQEKRTCIP